MVMVASKQQSKGCDMINEATKLPETGNKVCVLCRYNFCGLTGETTCVGLCMNECAFYFTHSDYSGG